MYPRTVRERMGDLKYKLSFASAALLFITGSVHAQVYYNQPYNGSDLAYSSQDSTGSFGDWALVYDDFTFSSSFVQFNTVTWDGTFFQGAPAPVNGFNIDFYTDNGGTPGTLALSYYITGDANQTFIGYGAYGLADYSYSANVGEIDAFNYGPFWVSIQADMNFPPIWGWLTSNVGNDNAYQTYFGNTYLLGMNQAFALSQTSTSNTPGPAALVPFGIGLLGVLRRRKAK
jgi:MYXO-CTERM domain-containing protein